MTSKQRVSRNSEIVTARARGQRWSTIATAFGVSERQARRVVSEHRASQPRLHQRDPLEIFEELYERYEAVLEQLAEVADEASNDSARVGALRARIEVMRDQGQLLRTVGILPLDALGLQIDLQSVADRFVGVFQRFDIQAGARDALLEAIEPRSREAEPPRA
jgi:hypothetical protein